MLMAMWVLISQTWNSLNTCVQIKGTDTTSTQWTQDCGEDEQSRASCDIIDKSQANAAEQKMWDTIGNYKGLFLVMINRAIWDKRLRFFLV